jgi:DNA repair exonuclease SbcCD ATPase subunit
VPFRQPRDRARRVRGDGRLPITAEIEVEQLRAALREHARDAERQRAEWEHELQELKESLRRRVQEVAAREQELKEAVRQRERRGRRRRWHRGSDGSEPPVSLERRARELDRLADELAARERELERRERELQRRELRGNDADRP